MARGQRERPHVLCKRDEIYPTLISITKIPLVVAIRLRHLAVCFAVSRSVWPPSRVLYCSQRRSVGDVDRSRKIEMECGRVMGDGKGKKTPGCGIYHGGGKGRTKKPSETCGGEKQLCDTETIYIIRW